MAQGAKLGGRTMKNEKIKYDEQTKKWFAKNFFNQTTVMKCEKCGLFFKPSLGHKCKKEAEE